MHEYSHFGINEPISFKYYNNNLCFKEYLLSASSHLIMMLGSGN